MFISCRMLWSSGFGSLLCIWLLVLLLLAVLPVSISRIPLNITPGLLQPLPIPSCHFESWSLDLITNLPLSYGCNDVLTCVDCT